MSPYLTAQDRRQRAHGAVDRLHDRLQAGDVHGFADVFAVNAVMELPCAPAAPVLRGREQVRAYLLTQADFTAVVSETRYDTTDPDVLIVEWAAATRHVTVLRVGAGGIESYRDYSAPGPAGE